MLAEFSDLNLSLGDSDYLTHSEDFITSLLPAIEKAAKRLSREWPGIEADDIRQEMTLCIVERAENIAKHDDRESIALGVARKAGLAYCSGERYFYQTSTAEWIYTPKEVRRVLASYYFNAEGWEDAPKKRDLGQTIEGDGISIALMDVRDALEALAEKDQALIVRVFDYGERVKDAERKATDRAIDRMTTYLNRGISERFDHANHDGPGSRDVMTNTQARHAID